MTRLHHSYCDPWWVICLPCDPLPTESMNFRNVQRQRRIKSIQSADHFRILQRIVLRNSSSVSRFHTFFLDETILEPWAFELQIHVKYPKIQLIKEFLLKLLQAISVQPTLSRWHCKVQNISVPWLKLVFFSNLHDLKTVLWCHIVDSWYPLPSSRLDGKYWNKFENRKRRSESLSTVKSCDPLVSPHTWHSRWGFQERRFWTKTSEGEGRLDSSAQNTTVFQR